MGEWVAPASIDSLFYLYQFDIYSLVSSKVTSKVRVGMTIG
jgi:hypothetical protein